MKRPLENGYTIIEVMIFLGISGVLFASAAVAVGGSQAQARYAQTVRDFESQIKDVINDVDNGYYPTYEKGLCDSVGNGVNEKVNFNASANADQGANENCINIGKTLMFNLQPDKFSVGVVVGLNPGINETLDLSLANVKPTLAYKNTVVDLTINKPIRFGSVITKIGNNSDPAIQYSSLSFISDFINDAGISSGSQENGVLNTSVYGVIAPNLPASPTLSSFTSDIEGLVDSSNYDVNPEEGFYICMLTTENKRARIIVGVDGVVTATKAEFDLPAPADGGVCP